ncbi:MAG: hypothetical protein IPK85_21715 [Gemmatimonadetes bacterium]|nr:hypothetical protein [Gemmatimonadota bacterium]
MSQRGKEEILADLLGRHVPHAHQDLAQASFVAMQSRVWHPARDRRGQIDKVAVPLGARAEHAVAEDDRVRFRPGDLFAE